MLAFCSLKSSSAIAIFTYMLLPFGFIVNIVKKLRSIIVLLLVYLEGIVKLKQRVDRIYFDQIRESPPC